MPFSPPPLSPLPTATSVPGRKRGEKRFLFHRKNGQLPVSGRRGKGHSWGQGTGENLYSFPVVKLSRVFPGGCGVEEFAGKFTYSTRVPSSIHISGSCCRASRGRSREPGRTG